MPKEQHGSHISPGPAAKHEMLQGTTTLTLTGVLAPIRKQPQQGRCHLRRLYCLSPLPPEQGFLVLSAKEHFRTDRPTSSPRRSIKPKERWRAGKRVQVVSALNAALVRGHWARERGKKVSRGIAALTNPSPFHVVMGHVEFALVGPQANSCTQLNGHAATLAPGTYSGSGLTVFTEEAKGNWTKSVSD